MQRSHLLFTNSIHSKETLRVYQYGLDAFIKHFKLRDYDSLTSMDSNMLQTMVEDYIMEKKRLGKSRSTIKCPISALELFCDTNDVMVNWKKIHRLLPPSKKKTGSKAYSTEQINQMLQATTEIRNKAIVHFLASTGVRIGALPQMKIKHIKNMADNCKIVTIYADEKEEYSTFLTPEASKALDSYLEKRHKDGEHLDSEHPLFREVYAIGIAKPKHLKKVSIQAIIDRIIRRAGIRYGRDGSRRDIQLDHGFRKRFNTIMKTTPTMNISLAEKMMGHSVTVQLDNVYLDPSDEHLFEEFKKAIPELTIDGTARKEAELEKANQEIVIKDRLIEQNRIAMEKMIEMGFKLQESSP